MVCHLVTSESFSTAQIPWDGGKHREECQEDPGVKREIGQGRNRSRGSGRKDAYLS